MLNKEQKQEIIKQFARSAQDTGSSEVQIALLSKRITDLSEHLKKFSKDTNSQRGLLRMIGQRRALLKYLKKNDTTNYVKVTQSLSNS